MSQSSRYRPDDHRQKISTPLSPARSSNEHAGNIVQGRAFPWKAHGMTFLSLGQLERTLEQLASGSTAAHIKAMSTLLNDARRAMVLSEDQALEIRKRLHM